MALFTLKFLPLSPIYKTTNFSLLSRFPSKTHSLMSSIPQHYTTNSTSFRISYRYYNAEDVAEDKNEDDAEDCSFDEAVALFNKREYYKCHDYLEALWVKAEEPTRTLVHGILQCAVGFHHLFNQVWLIGCLYILILSTQFVYFPVCLFVNVVVINKK